MPIRKRQSNPMLCMRAAPAKVPLQARRVQANPPERDPVLEVVFNALKRMSRNGRVVTYAKLQFKFLDHIKQLKQRCQDDAILESTLMFLAVEQKHGNTHADSHNKPTARDTPNVKARYCIEQMRELERDTRAIRRKAMLVLTNAIASTGYHLPPALSAKHITDLCTILYAITSDSYYRRPYAIQVNSQSTISKVHVINSINVLGGTPSSFKLVDISDSLWTFGQDLRMALSSAHLSQPTRLGTLDKTAAEQGLWLWQASSSIDTLKTSHEHWQILDSATFNDLKALSQRRLVFLIHVSTFPLLPRLYHRASSQLPTNTLRNPTSPSPSCSTKNCSPTPQNGTTGPSSAARPTLPYP